MTKFFISAIVALLLAAPSVANAQQQQRARTTVVKDGAGELVRVTIPRTHAQCMANGAKLKYSVAGTKRYCDQQFR